MGRLAPWGMAAVLCGLHSLAIWVGMGGYEQITSDWPIPWHDHPIHYHYSTVAPTFLRQSWTTAGYDPSFMAGYPKCIIFPASSTLGEVVAFVTGTTRPAFTYKLTVLISVASLPWLILAAVSMVARSGVASCVSVALFLVYFWVDFPINYAAFGMQSYLVSITTGVLVTIALARYIERGGWGWWLAGALGSSLVVMVHPTSAMVVAPAAAVSYLVGVHRCRYEGRAFPISRHLGVWAVPVVVLAVNAFWWWPGLLLASMKGDSGFAFSHPEGVVSRLGQVVGLASPIQPEIQVVLWGVGLAGVAVLARRDRVAASGVLTFAAGGFAWGYLAGALRSLDFLQPGRHTYALYTALAVVGGVAVSEALTRLRRGPARLDVWAVIASILLGVRLFGTPLFMSVGARLALGESGRGRQPFLSSEPPPRLRWVLSHVRETLKPGDRLLYEESGFDLPGVPDPFAGGRFSGLLPSMTGVEVIGGPYLHVALLTNFTQFGEGKLFGREAWNREHFERYGRLYGFSAILCWSPRARAFCRANPDLIEIVDDDGVLMFGRVRGCAGATIEGEVEVEAEVGRLVVRAEPDELDSRVVLRYHHVPCLRGVPPAQIGPVPMEADPVPFIGLRPQSTGATSLRMDFSPGVR